MMGVGVGLSGAGAHISTEYSERAAFISGQEEASTTISLTW